MAPACTVELFNEVYAHFLAESSTSPKIEQLVIYNLAADLELCDTVTPFYNKSLLYLVSNSFEEETETPILGMQKFSQHVEVSSKITIEVSQGVQTAGTTTASKTHGGFDNDRFTMNSILSTILNGKLRHPFTDDNLRY